MQKLSSPTTLNSIKLRSLNSIHSKLITGIITTEDVAAFYVDGSSGEGGSNESEDFSSILLNNIKLFITSQSDLQEGEDGGGVDGGGEGAKICNVCLSILKEIVNCRECDKGVVEGIVR